MTTVLCTNGLLSKTLAVVRSLGSRGIRTIAAEKTRWHASGLSKYCAKAVLNPDPTEQPERYFDWLMDTINREHCDVLFIMDEDTMNIAVNHREELEKCCRLLIPTKASYEIASDKGNTIELAMKVGVPCPATIQLENASVMQAEELLELAGQMDFPIVIKPRFSSGSRGIRIAHDRDQLIRLFFEVQKEYPNPILQEYIPKGTKYDIGLCFDLEHRLKASYVQKQIRNYPIERGPSTVHESAWFPELVDYSVKLMDHLPWSGVVDVEFMIDPRNSEPKLMEINPRYWSSLHLSIRSGVDFPWIMYQLAMGQEIDSVHHYTVGKRGRSLLPGDVLHFLSNSKRWSMDPPLWSTNLPDDIVSWKDPGPTAGFFMSALRYSLDAKTWRAVVRR